MAMSECDAKASKPLPGRVAAAQAAGDGFDEARGCIGAGCGALVRLEEKQALEAYEAETALRPAPAAYRTGRD